MKSIPSRCLFWLMATLAVAIGCLFTSLPTIAEEVHQESATAIKPVPSSTQLLGGRFLTLNTIVRVHQIEVTRDIAHGPDESLVHTVAEARTFREAIETAWPGARITWAFSWLALHDDRPQYQELRAWIASYHKKYGDEITFIPGAYFSNMYNAREQVNRDLHEGLQRVSEIVGGGYRPKSVVAGFLAADNLRYLADVEGIHVCQGNIWSQYAVDNGDGEGSVCYPYYPSREHFCKPARSETDFIDCVNLDGWTVDFLAARIPGQQTVAGERWRSRQGVGPIETLLDMGTERGTQSMLATTAAHFDDGFARNGFGWVTCGWEMGLVEARKIYGYGGRNGMEGLHIWLTETRKRWPDAQLITQGEFGLLWRAQFPNNDQWDYQFVHRGSGIRASQENLEMRWFMNRDFRLALLRDWQTDGPEKVIDFTRYDLRASEPADPTVDEPSRNWSLMNRLNQKGSRPQDVPISLSELNEAEQALIRGHYPELFQDPPPSETSDSESQEDWTHWRGPTADGRAGAMAKPPIRWGKDSNIAWVAELPGEGSATPLVVGNQIFILSAVKTDRKSPNALVNDERAKTVPDEMFYEFVVSSLDRQTGQRLWQKVAIEEVPHEGKHETNTYAAGSPVSDGQRLYYSFGSRGIFCYTLDGDLVWQADLGNMRTRNGWGEAVTPALTDESLIVNWDQEEGSFIVALDKWTGEVRWKKDRAGEVTSWNTPLITTFAGQQQVVVNGTGSVKSYAARDGALLWECGGQTVNAIPSPLRYRDAVICMSGYRGSLAVLIPLDSNGNVTDSATLPWKVTEGTPYVPSPILSGSRLLFTAGNTNVLSCLDANTGELLLEKMRLTGLRSLYASPILANGHFYFTSREGTTVVVRDNENLDIVAVNELDDVVDASPVAVDDQLFLRSWTKLYCIQEGTEPEPAGHSDTTASVAIERAAQWLTRHVRTGTLDVEGRPQVVSVIAWKDPTLSAEIPNRLTGYTITDTLWASYALSASHPEMAKKLRDSLERLGCDSNSLHEVICEPLESIHHKPTDPDIVHGRSLGIMTVDDVTVDVRHVTMTQDEAFTAGHPTLFAEHAVYQALFEFRNGQRESAKDRIRRIFHRKGDTDPTAIVWDNTHGLLTDFAGRSEFEKFQTGQTTSCRQYSFKLAVLLYAVRLMGLQPEFPLEVKVLQQRLRAAPLDSGGVPHFFDVERDGAISYRSGATGEATAIFILAETVRP
jgi:outer membrane protein assembly factor BamB